MTLSPDTKMTSAFIHESVFITKIIILKCRIALAMPLFKLFDEMSVSWYQQGYYIYKFNGNRTQ
jgi:hypothetical protein